MYTRNSIPLITRKTNTRFLKKAPSICTLKQLVSLCLERATSPMRPESSMQGITHFVACLLSSSAQQDPSSHPLSACNRSSQINLVGRPAPAHDSSYGQETRLDYDSYIPTEELPRSCRPRRSRSTSPRTSRVRDTEGDEAARHGAPAHRRPRDPETDISINEVEL